jgi:hypothetical protein
MGTAFDDLDRAIKRVLNEEDIPWIDVVLSWRREGFDQDFLAWLKRWLHRVSTNPSTFIASDHPCEHLGQREGRKRGK